MDGDKSSKSEMIMVRARNVEFFDVDDTPGRERNYSKVEFHMVDLKGGEIMRNFLPSMLNCNRRGRTVRLGSIVYIVGGLSTSSRGNDSLRVMKDDQVKYRGACRFDLTRRIKEKDSTWTPAPLPIVNQPSFNWASLCGKIYGFGMVEPKVEVFDPSVDQWKVLGPLPSDYDGCCVVGVLPDPKNCRIIVSLIGSNDCSWPLCAFYPPSDSGEDDARWVRLHRNFCKWSGMAALVDDVLYMYQIERSAKLWAYDLDTAKWLDIVWTAALLPEGTIQQFYSFKALFLLSTKDGILCLAASVNNYDAKTKRTKSTITLIKFRVERSSASTISCTPLHAQSHVLPDTSSVYDFLPLDECVAIESVLESTKVSCSYKIHGCPEEFHYSSKRSHELICAYIPCGCPFKDCAFVGSQRELCLHLNTNHINSVVRLGFGNVCKFSRSMAEEFVVFREEVDGTLFVLNKYDRMSLSFIDGSSVSKGDRFSYVLVVRGKDSCLQFQSLANGFQKSSNVGFIQVPSYFFDYDGCLRMELCIWSKGASCSDIAGEFVG